MEIRRDFYLNKLIKRKNNGLIKVITGICRCGKSYLLNNLFYHHLLESGVDADHIIRFAFDSADDLYLIGESLIQIEKEKRGVEPEKFMAYIRSKVVGEGKYYLLFDEIQMLDCFEAVLNGYLRDITKRNRVKNIGELEDLLNILSSAIGSLTNPEKLKNTFKTVKKSRITSATIKKYLDYFEDSFLIESAQRYDIKGKAYIETPKKYYFSDLGLRNARINFRQFEQTYSIYSLPDEAKRTQEIRPFRKIDDSFKKIVVTKDIVQPCYDDYGILTVNIYDFLLDPQIMEK